MADDLTTFLTRSSRQADMPEEQIKLIGEEAASMYLNEGVPLNRGISKLASEYPGINGDQISRVVEAANTSVYLSLHKKDKLAGQGHSYPQFDLADRDTIMGSMTSEASPVITGRTDPDYDRIPARSRDLGDDLLEELFDVRNATRRVQVTKEASVNEVMDLRHNLVDMKGHLEHALEQVHLLHKQASSEYYSTVKSHLLDGGSFADVLAAARASGASDTKVASVLRPVVVELIKQKVASPEALRSGVEGLEKVAHRVVNEDHPLVSLFGALASFEWETQKIASGLKEVDTGLDRVNRFVKESYLGQA